MAWQSIAAAGLGIGVIFGIFGAGGSAFATPVLALLGVPAGLAVASPLPAMLPASFVGARRYIRSGRFDRRIAALAVAGGLPGTLVGALLSSVFSGHRLLLMSGALLFAIGLRLVLPDRARSSSHLAARRSRSWLVASLAFGVGILTGLLANGGGFLLVPLFIVVLGLPSSEAAGTSIVAVGALAIPTVISHWMLGNIDWAVAAAFAGGLVPGSVAGSRIAERFDSSTLRTAFGAMLMVFAVWFLYRNGISPSGAVT